MAGLLGIIMDYNNEKQLSDPLLPSAESGSGPEAAPGRRSSIFAKTVGIAEDVVTRPVDIMKSSTFVDDYNKVRAEALPLTKAGDTGNFFHNFRWGDPNHDPTQREIAKVSLWRMFSYSTVRERCLMVLGLVLSTFTGLGIPAWLVLLAQSLDVSVEFRRSICLFAGSRLTTCPPPLSPEDFFKHWDAPFKSRRLSGQHGLFDERTYEPLYSVCRGWTDLFGYRFRLRLNLLVYGRDAVPTNPKGIRSRIVESRCW